MVVEEVIALPIWKNYSRRAIKYSRGTSRGTMTFCNRNKYSVKKVKENNHWIMTEIQSKHDKDTIFFCNVYRPTHYRDNNILGRS